MKLEKLQYFVNRPCTVFTTPINRNFKEENPKNYPNQLLAYFTGFVESVDEFGVMLRQFNDGKRTFVLLHNVVAVSEEALEAESEPVKQVKNAQVTKEPIKLDDLSKLSDQLREQFGK